MLAKWMEDASGGGYRGCEPRCEPEIRCDDCADAQAWEEFQELVHVAGKAAMAFVLIANDPGNERENAAQAVAHFKALSAALKRVEE